MQQKLTTFVTFLPNRWVYIGSTSVRAGSPSWPDGARSLNATSPPRIDPTGAQTESNSASEVETGSGPSVATASLNRWIGALLGNDERRRIRTTQWLISALVYFGSGLSMWIGARPGWMDPRQFAGWIGFLVFSLSMVFVALRSGWSERFADPALTSLQIVIGVLVVEWAYAISGPFRTVTLLPLLLIFSFGAFSLRWRTIAWLAIFTQVSMAAMVLALNATRPGLNRWSLENNDLWIDLMNVMMVMVQLPAIALIAARLSTLRSRLRAQRSKLTEALGEVQRLATHDDLTGLVNRRYMLARLTQEQYRFRRNRHAFSVALLDLDHFKLINDARGHDGGDEVLCAFARAVSSSLRDSDLVARWGGEEFLLLLPDTTVAQARATIERLQRAVLAIPALNGEALTFSAGATDYRADEELTATIARADHAMYAAKVAGRDRMIVE
jgi:diguanylate cyclase (GGDEF)-like protein